MTVAVSCLTTGIKVFGFQCFQHNAEIPTSEFDVVDSLVRGLGCADKGTKVGLLLVHGSSFERMPFLSPPMTPVVVLYTRMYNIPMIPPARVLHIGNITVGV